MQYPFTVSVFYEAGREADGSWRKPASVEMFSLYAKDHNDARAYANEVLKTFRPIILHRR